MKFRDLRDAVGEAGSLSVYAMCSIVGAVVRLGHHEEGTGRPVVLVPGFLGRGLAFVRLRAALIEQGHPVYVADLGFGVGCIREKSAGLEAFVSQHDLDDYFIVGHSMGGLIAMGMSEEARRKVRHFVTLGTTFRGAVLSYLFPVFPAARQLNPNSEFVTGLLDRIREQKNLTAVVARWDEIALPPQSCLVEGCDARTGVAGHAQLIMRSSAVEQLVDLLNELERSTTPGRDDDRPSLNDHNGEWP